MPNQVIPDASVEADDQAEWVARMSELIKKLGAEEALHDYVKTLRTKP